MQEDIDNFKEEIERLEMHLLELGVYILDINKITPKQYRKLSNANIRKNADLKYVEECNNFGLVNKLAVAINKPSDLYKYVPKRNTKYYTKEEILFLQMAEAVERAESNGITLGVDENGKQIKNI